MKNPKLAFGSMPDTTITHNSYEDRPIDRQIEDELDKIVHDSPFNFQSREQVMKSLSPARNGFPRHEW
jgi:hypothetical protein